MPNPLIRKLEYAGPLTDKDRARLEVLCRQQQYFAARQDLIREGERPDDARLVLSGFACRYKVLADGRRQNVALLIPGDICDLHVAILERMDHSLATLSPCTVVRIPRATILDLINNHSRITSALWWCTLVDEATLREWLVNMSRRGADQRVTHLLCELRVRLQAVGLADGNGYDLPLTQAVLGETMGLSAVHVNRTLQVLREAGLVEWKNRRITIPDIGRMEAFCDFTPNYLHLHARMEKDAPRI